MSLAEFQAGFARALANADAEARPAGLNAEAARRFRIYRNNVHWGLSQALAEAYPVVRRLVGDDFFFAAARAFLEGRLPRTRSLALYGAGFADFLEGFEPARAVPYLPDMARLERARLEALHAADAAPLDPETLSAWGTRMLELHLVPHSATRIVPSRYPIVSIWTGHGVDARTGGRKAYAGNETALMVRPRFEVEVLGVDRGTARFAAALVSGASIGTALAGALREDEGFDVTAAFRRLLAAGAFASIAERESRT
jgi:hypothetical protein